MINISIAITIGDILVTSLINSAPLILVAIGFTLLFKLFNFFNISHGEIMTLGGYFSLLILTHLGISLFISIIIAGIIIGIMNVLLYLGIFRTFFKEDYDMITLIVISLGISFILRYITQLAFGVRSRFYPVGRMLFSFEGISITSVQAFGIAVLFAAIFGTHFLLTRTNLGRIIRGFADNERLAYVHGISSLKIGIIVFFIAGMLGGLGGGFFGAYTYAAPSMGWGQLLTVIAIVIVGGIGNPYGAMAGGFTISLVETSVITFIGNEYALFSVFLILILVILIRPRGMIGSDKL